jgi:hypothetical protein
MKKRSAEKVISRSILALASYRKTTMGRALRRRPRFWTVAKPADDFVGVGRLSKRLRVEFGTELRDSPGLFIDPGVEMATASTSS